MTPRTTAVPNLFPCAPYSSIPVTELLPGLPAPLTSTRVKAQPLAPCFMITPKRSLSVAWSSVLVPRGALR